MELLVPLLTVVIGAAAGLFGGMLTAKRQARLELEKWSRGVSDAFRSEVRVTVKDLTTKIAAAIHSMCWLCWLAKYGPERLTVERVNQYDDEMHTLLPQITGLHAATASMDYRVYEHLKPLVLELVALDASIGEAGLAFVPADRNSASALAGLHQPSSSLEKRLAVLAAEAVRPYAIDAGRPPSGAGRLTR